MDATEELTLLLRALATLCATTSEGRDALGCITDPGTEQLVVRGASDEAMQFEGAAFTWLAPTPHAPQLLRTPIQVDHRHETFRAKLVAPIVTQDASVLGWVLGRAAPNALPVGEADAREFARVCWTLSPTVQRALERTAEPDYRSMFENCPRGLARVSIDGSGYAAINQAGANLLGYDTVEEFMATPPRDLWANPELRSRFVAELQAKGAVRRIENKLIRKDGTDVVVRGSARLVRDAEGNPLFLDAEAEDITEIKALEAERDLLETQLQHTRRMESLGRLAGGIAHDFANLLTAIGGFASLLEDSLPATDARHADADEISKAVSRGASLTHQLLAFSRHSPRTRQPLDLNDVVADMAHLLQRVLGEDVELTTVLAPDPLRIEGDQTQIEQIVLNLVVNARDAMIAGGRLDIATSKLTVGEPAVLSGVHVAAGDYAVLNVTDTGRGIPAETLRHMFDPFYTSKEVGTGLGLSIVTDIVDRHGGKILVQSAAQHGTTFKILLPLTSRVGAPPQPEIPRDSVSGSETVLFVEDDAAILRLATRVLQLSGYHVFTANNGADALARWHANRDAIDVVVTDIVLPDTNGIALAERLRAESGRRPGFVLVSSLLDRVPASGATVSEQAHFVGKPYTPYALMRAIRQAVSDN